MQQVVYVYDTWKCHFKEISRTGLKVYLPGGLYEKTIKHFTTDRFFECSQSSRRDLSAV